MKNWLLVGIVLLFLDLSFVKSAPIEELVKGLPLYSDFYKGDIYSGYYGFWTQITLYFFA